MSEDKDGIKERIKDLRKLHPLVTDKLEENFSKIIEENLSEKNITQKEMKTIVNSLMNDMSAAAEVSEEINNAN